ncbi:MAG: thioredoxin fold domain-containing protein [Chloroflexi bacterium]|nr:thioredoxin fold domain-containing protein [Chloroflexota bacterium]
MRGIRRVTCTAITAVLVGLVLAGCANPPGKVTPTAPVGVVLGRPTLVTFEAEGCPFCARMRPVVDELEQRYGDRVSFLNLNYQSQEGQARARDYRVFGHPTFVVLDKEGKPLRVIAGVVPRATLEDALKESLK